MVKTKEHANYELRFKRVELGQTTKKSAYQRVSGAGLQYTIHHMLIFCQIWLSIAEETFAFKPTHCGLSCVNFIMDGNHGAPLKGELENLINCLHNFLVAYIPRPFYQ